MGEGNSKEQNIKSKPLEIPKDNEDIDGL